MKNTTHATLFINHHSYILVQCYKLLYIFHLSQKKGAVAILLTLSQFIFLLYPIICCCYDSISLQELVRFNLFFYTPPPPPILFSPSVTLLCPLYSFSCIFWLSCSSPLPHLLPLQSDLFSIWSQCLFSSPFNYVCSSILCSFSLYRTG